MRRSPNWTHIGQRNSGFIGKRPSTKRWQRAASMTDVELTRALERGEIANESFHHVSHLHVAWVYLAESSSIQQAATKMRESAQPLANRKNITRPSHCFGCIFSHVRTPPVAENLWKTLCMQIRNCWKRIFHSLIIRPGGSSVTKRELHGLNPI